MIEKEKDGIRLLEFELFCDIKNLKCGVFLRSGGISEGPFASLNLSFSVGDSPDAVEKNREKITKEAKGTIVPMKANHGSEIERVVSMDWESPFCCDALSTSHPNISLLVTHADCQAAVFYDTKNHAIANVHCGWRGNVQNIYAKTVEHMRKNYHTSPQELLVAISPSLGPSSAEFVHYRNEFPESFWNYQIRPNFFDLWAISRDQLTSCGILPHHIQIAEIDTYSSPEHYFSYRRDKVCGRNATFATLL